MTTVRIGVIGTANTHAYQYIGLLNGWRDDVPFPAPLADGRPSGIMNQAFGTHLREAARTFPENVTFDGAEVTRLWSEGPAEAELIERACGVLVVDDPADAVRDVDAVLVLTEDPELHLPHAELAFLAGLPTYIDKPLAGSVEHAHAIAELAENCGVPWYSASSLRWSPSLRAMRTSVTDGYGGVQDVYVQCPGRAPLYAIHAVEVMGLLMGTFAVHDIRAARGASRDVVVLDLDDGRSAVLENNGSLDRMSYTAIVQSRLRQHVWVEQDFGLMNVAFVRSFLEFVTTGRPPVSPAEALQSFALSQRTNDELRAATAE